MATSGATNVTSLPGISKTPGSAVVVTNTARQAPTANAAATATLPGVAGKTTYITSLSFGVGTAAAAVTLLATLAGIIGGTWSIDLDTVASSPLFYNRDFENPLPASAVNTALVGTIPASGAAGPAIFVVMAGFQL